MTGEEIYDALLDKTYPDGWEKHINSKTHHKNLLMQYTTRNMLYDKLPDLGASKLLAHFEELLETDYTLIEPQLRQLYEMPLYSNNRAGVVDRAWEDFMKCPVPECGMLIVKSTYGLHNKTHHDTGEAPAKPKRQKFGWSECIHAMIQHYGTDMQAPGVVHGATKAIAFTEPAMRLVGRAGSAMCVLPSVDVVIGNNRFADIIVSWMQYRKELFNIMSIFNTPGVWKKIKPLIMRGEYDAALMMGMAHIIF